MSHVLVRRVPAELTHDPRFAGRVKRLALTAVVALGLIWWLAVSTLDAPAIVGAALAAGWVLMPAILVASLAHPRLRYALVVPATLVGVALLAISAWSLPPNLVVAAGWLLIASGISLGGLMGLWFWFRLLPVPNALDDPFSSGRLTLIGLHVALIVVGLALASLGLVVGG
jgi:hypothetical protein